MKLNKKSLLETYIIAESTHARNRLENRIGGLPISGFEKDEIINNFRTVDRMLKSDLSPFAIKLGDVSPAYDWAESKHGSQYVYYKDNGGEIHIGNEVWGIVRNNKIVTVVVRKDTQTSPINKAKQHFRVNNVFYDISDID